MPDLSQVILFIAHNKLQVGSYDVRLTEEKVNSEKNLPKVTWLVSGRAGFRL